MRAGASKRSSSGTPGPDERLSRGRWINAIQGDGYGKTEAKLGDATPRSLRLSKLIVGDQGEPSAQRVEVVTSDPLTNKVPPGCLASVLFSALARSCSLHSTFCLPALIRAFAMCFATSGAREAGDSSAHGDAGS